MSFEASPWNIDGGGLMQKIVEDYESNLRTITETETEILGDVTTVIETVYEEDILSALDAMAILEQRFPEEFGVPE